MAGTTLHFSPANQLLDEAEALCKQVHPGTFSFPRWYSRGGSLWLESSARSRLMGVNFHTRTVTLPEWATERGCETPAWPSGWDDLYQGSLFSADGSAHDAEMFEAAQAAWVRGRKVAAMRER